MPEAKLVALVALIVIASGCDAHDIGQDCPQLTEGLDEGVEDGSRTETLEVVGQSTQFPCEELICVASQGIDGYCSAKCRGNSCPDGFECRVVQGLGDFADEEFCAWKTCLSAKDCGNEDDFCCKSIEGSDPATPIKLCQFGKKGACL